MDFLSNKDSMELPKVKHIHVEHIKDSDKAGEFLLSSIEFVPSKDGNKLYACSQVLDNIKTEIDGDTLILKLDLSNKKLRSEIWQSVDKNIEKTSLLTVAIDKDVVNISSNKAGFKQPIYYLFKGFTLPHFTVKMNNSHVVLAECTMGQLEVSCVLSLDLRHVKAEILKIMDSSKDNSLHLQSDQSGIDTLEAKVHQKIFIANTKDIKYIQWEALQEDATIQVTLNKGQTLEEVDSDK